MFTVKYLLVDLNSFFASCEQQDNPRLRGKAIAVVPMLADNTSVIASSIEAKRKGVKTGTKVFEAKKLCPGILFIEADHRRYTKYHHKIVEAVEQVCPLKKVLSIDEMACELIGRETQEENAIQIAKKMKAHIQSTVGECLTTSIGLSTNILLAKMASDLVKPDGLVSVPLEKIAETFDHLPIESIPGIGRNMKLNLNGKGFFKIADLRAMPPHKMKNIWGSIVGLKLSEELSGKDFKSVNSNANTKSLSHQHVLAPDFRTTKAAIEILLKLATKAAYRLRENKQKCKSLYISIKDQYNTERFERSLNFQETDDTFYILDLIKKLVTQVSIGKPIKVGVALGGLTLATEKQLSLFVDPKTEKLGHVMDLVNKKFGPNTLMPGGYLNVLGQAKTRIAFHHIPKLDDEFDDKEE